MKANFNNFETYAIYNQNEALAFAKELMPKDGSISDRMVSDPTTYSFREVDQWSGEIGAYAVEDENFNTIAVVAYWD